MASGVAAFPSAAKVHRRWRTAPSAVFRANAAFRPPKCSNGHPLAIVLCRVGSQVCDSCLTSVRSTFTHRCRICDYDLCIRCFELADPDSDVAGIFDNDCELREECPIELRDLDEVGCDLRSPSPPSSLATVGAANPTSPQAAPPPNAVPVVEFESATRMPSPLPCLEAEKPRPNSLNGGHGRPAKSMVAPRLERVYCPRPKHRHCTAQGWSVIAKPDRRRTLDAPNYRGGWTGGEGIGGGCGAVCAMSNTACSSLGVASPADDDVDSAIVENPPRLPRSEIWFMEVMSQVVRSSASPFRPPRFQCSPRTPSLPSRSRPQSVSGNAAGVAFMWQPADPSRLEQNKVPLPEHWHL